MRSPTEGPGRQTESVPGNDWLLECSWLRVNSVSESVTRSWAPQVESAADAALDFQKGGVNVAKVTACQSPIDSEATRQAWPFLGLAESRIATSRASRKAGLCITNKGAAPTTTWRDLRTVLRNLLAASRA